MASPPELILASGSPRRRELLTHLGVPFRVMTSDIPEISVHDGPAEVARDLAEQKARAVRALLPGVNAHILAADTLVALHDPALQDSGQSGTILGKPISTEQNAEYLHRLSGRTHRVYSGVALLGPAGELHSGVEMTEVSFRSLSESEIQHYARSGEGLDKAGGYGIQGLGMALVARIGGDYSSVVGFPLTLVISLLRGAGVSVWGQA
ncbi:nucleoside triphosphate pyrophosphatase [Deinococcus radiomollis]|uniref:Maf family protein n=1 Tax=Deinococcus radiomollis TaxID=468916 RepID=UPI003891A1C6